MNDIDRDESYDHARAMALTLPTWVLRLWERRAAERLSRGAPTAAERARLLAVRVVLRERDRR
jgi:hypothetical protein